MTELKLKPPPKSFDDFYRSKFFTGDELVGKKVTVTIEKFYQTDLKSDEKEDAQTVIVAKLHNEVLMLKINYTNACCLKAMFGPDFRQSEGKSITITAERERVGPDELNVVRIFGSADIKQDVTVDIKMPFRKNPLRRVIKAPRQANAQTQSRPSEQHPAKTEPERKANENPEDFDRS
jgi:hypothetical protein